MARLHELCPGSSNVREVDVVPSLVVLNDFESPFSIVVEREPPVEKPNPVSGRPKLTSKLAESASEVVFVTLHGPSVDVPCSTVKVTDPSVLCSPVTGLVVVVQRGLSMLTVDGSDATHRSAG